MEHTLRLLDSAVRDRARKRQRQQPPADKPSPAASETSVDTAVAAEDGLDQRVPDEGLQQRLKDAVHGLVANRHRHTFRGSLSSAFAARTAVGSWLALHAVKPQPLGIEWAAQLYTCFFLVTGAYRAGPESFEHLEMLQIDDLVTLITLLGRASAAGSVQSNAEQQLMMAARQWSRAQRDATGAAMVHVSTEMRDDKRVRLAVEGVLFNAHRADRLFA